MLDRVNQLYLNLFDKYSDMDDDLVVTIMTQEHKQIFNKLLSYQKKHSFRVMKRAICKIYNKNYKNITHNEIRNIVLSEDEAMIISTTALLHDVGKIKAILKIKDMIIATIINKIIGNDKHKKYKNPKLDVYFNHGEYGYEILKNENLTIEQLETVRYHHKKEFRSYLKDIISSCDDLG